MIRKTEAIVLRTRKYSETSLITTLYTLESGIQNFLVKGYRSAKGKRRHSYFQPMSVIEVVYYHKDSRDLQMITESNSKVVFQRLQTDPVRITLGLMTVELFHRCVKEEEKNFSLYHFLREHLLRLEKEDTGLIHIFIHFFLHLTKYLGFFPSDQSGEGNSPATLGLVEGIFTRGAAGSPAEEFLRQFMYADAENCRDIKFGNAEKNEMVKLLLHYYQIHVEGFRELETMKVFEEIFR